MASRLDHAGINVPDVPAAVDFFRTVFGAREVFRLPRFADAAAMERNGAPAEASLEIVMLDLGGAHLELLGWGGVADGDGGPAPHAAAPRGAHLAIEVPDVADALACVAVYPGAVVVGAPATFDEGPTPGLTNAFVRAPWGTLIELVDWGQPA